MNVNIDEDTFGIVEFPGLGVWLLSQWPYAAGLTSVFLTVVLPPLYFFWGLPLTLALATLPLYMVHQIEEHAGDRFRRYVNQELAAGHPALGPTAVFLINSVGVWLVILISVFGGWLWNPGCLLLAAYLVLINGFVHLAAGIVKRAPNPGIYTGCFLFLPTGFWTLVEIQQAFHPGVLWHARCFFSILTLHLAIVIHVKSRLRAFKH
jgi:hypothetical protein